MNDTFSNDTWAYKVLTVNKYFSVSVSIFWSIGVCDHEQRSCHNTSKNFLSIISYPSELSKLDIFFKVNRNSTVMEHDFKMAVATLLTFYFKHISNWNQLIQLWSLHILDRLRMENITALSPQKTNGSKIHIIKHNFVKIYQLLRGLHY